MQPITPARAPLKVDRKTDPSKREVYSNFAEIAATRMDFLLKFSVQRDIGPAHVSVTSVMDITMSPQQAKAVHLTLGGMLADYERQYGGPIPQETTPPGTAVQ